MLGLGDYESSNEDEVEINSPAVPKQELKVPQAQGSPTQWIQGQSSPNSKHAIQEQGLEQEPNGPALGPMHHAVETSQAAREQLTTSRSLIHNLTLPPVPNLNIPPSPPGSPNPSSNSKFAHFLLLKKQDVHFNEKLASSISLKNPSLLEKMMNHAGIDERAQYSSSLPSTMWSVSNLPSWGYKEELLRAQKELNPDESRLKGPRDSIEFVSNSTRPGPTDTK